MENVREIAQTLISCQEILDTIYTANRNLKIKCSSVVGVAFIYLILSLKTAF